MKTAPPAQRGTLGSQASEKQGPSSTNIPNVIAMSEFQRIMDSVKVQPKDATVIETSKMTSRQRVKKWPNTVEAKRQQRLDAQQKRLNDFEEAQKRMEAEELGIQRANELQLRQRAEEMKRNGLHEYATFNRTAMLCNVLAEREEQIMWKNELDKLHKGREQHHAHKQQQSELLEEERERKDAEDKQTYAMRLKQLRLDALEAAQKRHQEAASLKKTAMEEYEKQLDVSNSQEAEFCQAQRERERAHVEEMRKCEHIRKQVETDARRLEQEEAERATKIADQQEAWQTAIRNRHKEIYEKPAIIAERATRALGLITKEPTAKERLQTLNAESHSQSIVEKVDLSSKQREDQRKRQQALVVEHRNQQSELKMGLQEKERQISFQVHKSICDQDELSAQNAEATRQQRKTIACSLAATYQSQMLEKEQGIKMAKHKEREEAARMVESRQTAEMEFRKFAEAEVHIAGKAKKNVLPMERCLRELSSPRRLGH